MKNNEFNKNGITSGNMLASLISKLKDMDNKQARIMRSLYIFYVVLVVFLSGLYILNPDPELSLYQRLTGVIMIAAFSMMTFVVKKYYKRLLKIDYTQSVYQVMKIAEKRYKFWEKKRLATLFVFVFLVDIAVSMVFNGRYLPDSLTWVEKTLLVQAVYIPVMTISFFLGWLQWRKEKKQILDNIQALLKDLEDSSN